MKARLILILVAIASVIATIQAPTASASTVQTSGRPGSSTFSQTVGSYDMGEVVLTSGPVQAYRSPAYAGTQNITITWRVWKTYGGTWSFAGQGSTTYAVKAGQYLGIPGWTHRGLPNYYSTDLTITWKTPTGTVLGSVYRDLVESRDYACATTFCSVSWIGGQAALFLY